MERRLQTQLQVATGNFLSDMVPASTTRRFSVSAIRYCPRSAMQTKRTDYLSITSCWPSGFSSLRPTAVCDR